jgi:hypothetical protein
MLPNCSRISLRRLRLGSDSSISVVLSSARDSFLLVSPQDSYMKKGLALETIWLGIERLFQTPVMLLSSSIFNMRICSPEIESIGGNIVPLSPPSTEFEAATVGTVIKKKAHRTVLA